MNRDDSSDPAAAAPAAPKRSPGAWPAQIPRHLSRFRVEFGDCDPAAIVYFPNYYRWFDQATHALCEAAGYPLADLRARHGWIGFPIAEAGARFRATASTGDPLRIETRVKTWHERFFDLEHRVYRDEALLVEGWQKRFIGFNDAQQEGRLRALVIPDAFREAVAALAGGASAGL